MTKKSKTEELRDTIYRAVMEYLDNEESYSDDTQLEINTNTMEVTLADADQDLPGCDYYEVMDLVRGDENSPGQWTPDNDAIEEVVADYITE